MKAERISLTNKQRRELIAQMIKMNEGIEATQVPEPPADLEPGAKALFYKLRKAASIAMVSGDELANFCRSYYAIGFWRHEKQEAEIYGYYRQKEEAINEILKHGRILAKYDRVLLDIVYEMCPELRPPADEQGQHRTDDETK